MVELPASVWHQNIDQLISIHTFAKIKLEKEKREIERILPVFDSSDLGESSHIKVTLEREIGICKGFLNSIFTFTGSAKGSRKQVKKDTGITNY